MKINTHTLASIYEIQGHKEEAMMIYESILARNPRDKEASAALIRLKAQAHNFSSPNIDKLSLFVNASTQSDYQELEQWLISWE